MVDKKAGVLEWDSKIISVALMISEADAISGFQNGKNASFLIITMLANKESCRQVSQQKYPFHLVDSDQNRFAVRCITSSSGVDFNPAKNKGVGRSYNDSDLLDKMDSINGYIVADIYRFPLVPYWVIPVEQILEWWGAGSLGKKAHRSRKKILELINNMS